MPPKLFEVYKFEFRFGFCLDRRPWIVVREPFFDADGVEKVRMYGCSTQNYGPDDFKIDKNDPDFPTTGITFKGNKPQDNFVDRRRIANIPVSIIGPVKGSVGGGLLIRFKKWARMP